MELKLLTKKEGKNMLDIQELQIAMQLIENISIMSDNLENAYNKRNSEEFMKAGKEIINSQRKLTEILG